MTLSIIIILHSETGYLCLLDSTHEINASKWKLSAILVQTKYGIWLPGAQFFLEVENSSTVSAGLKAVKEMVASCGLKWEPRYFVIDQSKIETKALWIAFPGLLAGEQEISIYYCKIHLIRTLMTKLKKYPHAFRLILKAMHRQTRYGCMEDFQKAVDATPTQEAKPI